ncbi:S-adenosyl-L-methionine-dependent methyltransferase [Choiromyces venosus 120613-1]|uniref:S-adenosyl-L-methionine-dependent methyltransferase n=1 Tax=Choiromyces venosus 120613-1 TaxID=1336337 RepID=A0A3N4J5C7_9PEZI|nr:S-adenosyl-L-methionine-dependent methyltransferase [Choiromyces venosus 120613-1]
MPLNPSNTKDMFHTVEDILQPTDARERFRKHFLAPIEAHDQKWADLWEGGEFLPWDKGMASPALVDLMDQQKENPIFVAHNHKSGAKTALVPGCGRGYDVLLLAQHGYHAVGVDISAKAIDDAKEWVNNEINKLRAAGEPLPTGRIDLIAGDFFKDDWVVELGIDPNGGFDVIYDYAFLVALNPALRTKVAARMHQFLASGQGVLIALEYPLFRPAETGGPPHGIKSEDYDALFGEKFSKALHFMPKRTHKVGEGSDMVSVWVKKHFCKDSKM